MEGILFLVNMIAIGIVIYWCKNNDHVGLRERTSGFLGETLSGRRKGAQKGLPPAETRGDRNVPKGR